LTHTLPLDFAAAISGLEAVPPADAVDADFLLVPAAEEPAAGGVAAVAEPAGAEVVGAGALLEAAEDLGLLVFAAAAFDGLAAGAEGAAGVASAFADFLLLLFFLAVVVSDEPAALPVAEVWAVASPPDDFFLLLDFDLPEVEEVSAPLALELPAASAFALLLDFVPEDFKSLEAPD
jgi:hypothetical protein